MNWAKLGELLAMGGYGLYVVGIRSAWCAGDRAGRGLAAAAAARAPGGALRRSGARNRARYGACCMKPRHKRHGADRRRAGRYSASPPRWCCRRSRKTWCSSSADAGRGKEAPAGTAFRIGGLVEQGSVKRDSDGLTVSFNRDRHGEGVPVTYTGILPDLFKEGKGVVAQGRLGPDGVFRAQEVLAKHDENYMPPEAAHAVEQARPKRAERRAKQQSVAGAAR